MNWLQALELIADRYPLLFLIVAATLSFLPRLLDFLAKTNRMQVDTSVDIIEKITQKLNVIHNRCEELEKELDEWRTKYYEVKEELIQIKAENEKLILQVKNQSDFN